MIDVSINSDISEISSMIDKLKNYSDKLDSIKENPVSPEAKNMIDEIKQKSYKIFRNSQNLYYKIKQELSNTCEHKYVIDRTCFDISKTYKVCEKCGDMI